MKHIYNVWDHVIIGNIYMIQMRTDKIASEDVNQVNNFKFYNNGRY